MKKNRFTEDQIGDALQQAQAGVSAADVIRRMGVSEQTFYRRTKLYGGVGELRRPKQLAAEPGGTSPTKRWNDGVSRLDRWA